MERQLERSIRYFLTTRYRGREDVRDALTGLRRHGRLVLIGGMLRDLALFGNDGFRSDVDSVIVPDDLAAFENHMNSIGAATNRFGGYALPSRRWQIDVWPLERTWAQVEGHVKVRTLGDLLSATFFKCDAIIYDIDYRRIKTAPGYFQDLDRKLLEINLQPNPNPKGNAVRAFRYALMKGFRWGPQLSRFIDGMVASHEWDALLEVEKRSFGQQYLNEISINELRRELRRYVSSDYEVPFDPSDFRRDVQPKLCCFH